jgi:hypothetical protein
MHPDRAEASSALAAVVRRAGRVLRLSIGGAGLLTGGAGASGPWRFLGPAGVARFPALALPGGARDPRARGGGAACVGLM